MNNEDAANLASAIRATHLGQPRRKSIMRTLVYRVAELEGWSPEGREWMLDECELALPERDKANR